MTQPIIEIVVDPQGRSQLTTQGFTGAACRHASQALERALGVRTHETLTAEYYAASTTQAVQPNAVRPH